ncbi:anthranilate phosphoribosyltransferase [Arenicella xantha]|uniref:Anthranilate phosphoribosyltransferase n=1 Tax=Arenicella xantha TaxID=644221 RepID=A0A395JV12_9GAMM|nr:anthranilate phosphoribosyltransferase [Arenicella xantha]RBP53388.1 anthranilate phosphoribosyltransferase [Arenicella xantha]
MNIQHAIAQVVDGHSLSRAEMRSVMQQIMTGECTDAQIGGLLIGLRMKGETVDEITAAAEVMASLADAVSVNTDNLIDIVGTGGDGTSTFNVSTAASFVAAGAGASVAKHGNRSVSSKSGSADLLEQAGANLSLNANQVAAVIEQSGVGFMFAPMHHSAMRYAIAARKEMAVRTLFNVLGPLTNPAGVKRQVVGVFSPLLTEILAHVLQHLGSQHALVVHSDDGMDEISICAPTQITELSNGTIRTYQVQPSDFGLSAASIDQIVVDSPEQSLALVDQVLAGQPGAARDIVLLNAGAGIYVSGLAESLADGVQQAANSIDSGRARQAKENYIAATNHETNAAKQGA